MKRMIIITLILMLTIPALAPSPGVAFVERKEAISPYESLINAIVQVESNGNLYAFNKREGAYGAFQIRAVRLRDYNRKTGSKYILRDMYDFTKARKVFIYYCQGRDFETISREWNGSGWRTKVYWNKVKRLI